MLYTCDIDSLPALNKLLPTILLLNSSLFDEKALLLESRRFLATSISALLSGTEAENTI